MPNKAIAGPMGEFTDKYLSRSRAFIAEYENLIRHGKTPKQAADLAWQRVHYDELVQNATAESMIKAAVIGAGPDITVGVGKFDRNFILQKWVDMDGVKLSTTLYHNAETAKQIIANEVQAQLKLGRSYKQAAQFLQDETGIFQAKAPQYLENLYEKGRRALAGDAEALRGLRDEIRGVQKQIDRLSASGTTDRLKVNYQKLVDAVDSGNVQAMEKRLERAVMEKARYQAERVARTETARAYGDAKMAQIQADEDSTGWKWVLSSGENHCEICTFNAEADLHGMGPGAYPLSCGPDYPIHPNDTCLVRPFYKPNNGTTNIDPDAAIDYIQGLSQERQIDLLGNNGYEQFSDNPKSWRDAMGYQAEVKKEPQINIDI